MAVENFGTERDDIRGSKFPKYKCKEGVTDRVGIIPYAPKKYFKGAKTHFKDRKFLCKSTSEKKEICCLHSYQGNNPSYTIGAVLIIYNLGTKNGKPSLIDYTLMPWIFSEKMYDKLRNADSEFPLDAYDIKLSCNGEEKYQVLNVQSCSNSIWASNPTFKQEVMEKAKPLFESINRSLGADLSITEIKELLGVDTQGSEDAAVDIDVGSIAATIE